MKKSIVTYVGWLLVFSALAFYLYGIGKAIYLSWVPAQGNYSELLSTTIGSMQALLLTNLGVLLGIAVAKPQSALARQLMLTNPKTKNIAEEQPTDPELREKIQLFALCIYIIALVACTVTWVYHDSPENLKQVVSVVQESGKMFIGVILAYLTAVLATPRNT